MKRYNVKIGNHVADGDGYATIAEAKRKIKKLEHADDAYDISRSDGYYKVVEREVGPWIKTKGIAQKTTKIEQCMPPVAQKTTKIEQPGNIAAMREALKYVLQFDATDEAAEEDGLTDAERIAEYADHIEECQKKARAALAAPPRNCDVGTPKEQRVRFITWCENHNLECEDCPLRAFRDSSDCGFAWMQMPCEEKEKSNEQHQ